MSGTRIYSLKPCITKLTHSQPNNQPTITSEGQCTPNTIRLAPTNKLPSSAKLTKTVRNVLFSVVVLQTKAAPTKHAIDIIAWPDGKLGVYV